MNVTVRTRHGYVPASLMQEAEERMRKLQRFEVRETRAHLLFDQDNEGRRVETRLAVSGGDEIIASAVAPSFRDAMERALQRVERQLKRQRERYRDHTVPRVPASS